MVHVLDALHAYVDAHRWLSRVFDWWYGADTHGINDDLRSLGVSAEHAASANGYEAIQIPVFQRLLRRLSIDPKKYCFVDFGSGKGRALLLAERNGFKRAIGVEIAPSLHAVALNNIDRFRRRTGTDCVIETHLGDAGQFLIPTEDPAVLFFYNPFDDTVLSRVLDNIARSLCSRPREVIVVYRNAVHDTLLQQTHWLECLDRERSFSIYRNKRAG